jgi:hypothetical protein
VQPPTAVCPSGLFMLDICNGSIFYFRVPHLCPYYYRRVTHMSGRAARNPDLIFLSRDEFLCSPEIARGVILPSWNQYASPLLIDIRVVLLVYFFSSWLLLLLNFFSLLFEMPSYVHLILTSTSVLQSIYLIINSFNRPFIYVLSCSFLIFFIVSFFPSICVLIFVINF